MHTKENSPSPEGVDEIPPYFDFRKQISLYFGRAYYSYLGMLAQLLKQMELDKELKPGMGNILLALYEKNNQTSAEIGAKLGLARSTMARLIKLSQEQGIVSVKPDPDDKRAIRISLTPRALELKPRCLLLASRIDNTICKGFSEGERKIFCELLQRATLNISEELDCMDKTAIST